MKLTKIFLALALMLVATGFIACQKEPWSIPPAFDYDNTKVIVEPVLIDGSTISTPMF